MEFREITSFLEVARLKSFSKAAQNLGYSQAAVTIQIKNLEQELGVRLFDRIGKQVSLTHQGIVFIHYANQLVNGLSQAKSALAAPSALSGRLCIGAIESVCASLLPPLIVQYHRLYPGVDVSIYTESPDRLLELMNRNALDIVYFLDKKKYDPKWVKALEEPDQAIFVANASHPLAGLSISLEEIIRQPLILTEKNASYRFLLEQHLASLGMEIHPFLEIGSTDFIIGLLKKGLGLSFLPAFTVRKEIEKGLLAQVYVPGFTIQVYKQIVYHKDKWVSREMSAFLNLATGRKQEDYLALM